MERFKYLGSFKKKNGTFEEDMKCMIKWRELRGCEMSIPIRLKGKFS